MLDVHLTPRMQEFAGREIAVGRYAGVFQPAMRKLMKKRGREAFLALKADLAEQLQQTAMTGEAVYLTGLQAARLSTIAHKDAVPQAFTPERFTVIEGHLST